MRVVVTILWFLTAFVAGAAIFAVSRPSPMVQALVIQLKGRGLLERCHQARTLTAGRAEAACSSAVR